MIAPIFFSLVLGAATAEARIDLNHATPAELMQLPGVGAKKALGIISLRDKRRLRRTTEIMRVRGIGPKLFARIKDRLSVDAETPGQPILRAGDAQH